MYCLPLPLSLMQQAACLLAGGQKVLEQFPELKLCPVTATLLHTVSGCHASDRASVCNQGVHAQTACTKMLRLLHSWSEAAEERGAWRDRIQNLLGHTQHRARICA